MEYITRKEFNSLDESQKDTVKGVVDFHKSYYGEDLTKFYEDLGYDVEKDVMILALDKEKGTILKPMKIIEDESDHYVITFLCESRDCEPYITIAGVTDSRNKAEEIFERAKKEECHNLDISEIEYEVEIYGDSKVSIIEDEYNRTTIEIHNFNESEGI